MLAAIPMHSSIEMHYLSLYVQIVVFKYTLAMLRVRMRGVV
jgi:hypothetical protein